MEQDLLDNWPHVKKRHQTYTIRVPVPKELQDAVGKKEISRSLGTSDPEQGKLAYAIKLAEVRQQFEDERRNSQQAEPAPLTPEMAQAYVQAYFAEEIYLAEQEAHAVMNAIDDEVDGDPAEIRSDIQINASLELQEWRARGTQAARGLANRILMKAGFPTVLVKPRRENSPRLRKAHVDESSEGYLLLLKQTYFANVEMLERVLSIMDNKEYQLRANSISREPGFISLPQNIAPPTALAPHAQTYETISIEALLNRYVDAEEITGRRELDLRVAFRPLFALNGEQKSASALTRQDIRDVFSFIKRMPTQIGNNQKKWQGMTLPQIVEATAKEDHFEDDLLSARTVNKYMSNISKVLSWAEEEQLIHKNVARGIRIPNDEIDDDEAKRKPFTPSQLHKLFSTPIFTDPDFNKPSMYWATLIALFQGMRCEEILQLKLDDIQTDENDIQFFDIHKRNGNHLKNKPSVRKLPINHRLFDFGIQGLFDAAKKVEDGSLFPDLKRAKESRYTPPFSQRFSRYLEQYDIKEKKISFHSLRHNFRDEARVHAIPDDRVCALGGWKLGQGVQASYGTMGLAMDLKKEAIKLMTYQSIDFSPIKIIDWI